MLVEVGYLMAQLTDHEFPEESYGFSSGTVRVPRWKPSENIGTREGIRVDSDPGYLTLEFDLKQ